MHETYNSNRSFPIQSAQVAQRYKDYEKSLGEIEKDFNNAMRRETRHLVMIDDIIDELAMLKRTHEDQTHVLNLFSEKGLQENKIRYKETQYMAWSSNAQRLNRLIEDAARVRQSLTTLLDLRQRQVNTESAIHSGQQSQILFDQSTVLFTFTLATIIFAPLSWVTSLLDLNIEVFTPAAWSRGQVAAASSKFN